MKLKIELRGSHFQLSGTASKCSAFVYIRFMHNCEAINLETRSRLDLDSTSIDLDCILELFILVIICDNY